VIGSRVLSDNCDSVALATASNDLVAALGFGANNVTWTATDGRGNTATADPDRDRGRHETNPVVNDPADITVDVNAGLCYWTGSIGAAAPTDLCGISTTVATLGANTVTGATQFSGNTSGGGTTHVVTWTVTDNNGNTNANRPERDGRRQREPVRDGSVRLLDPGERYGLRPCGHLRNGWWTGDGLRQL
jgi:hypothetical protein